MRSDRAHDPAAAELALVPQITADVGTKAEPNSFALDPAPRMLGSVYVEVQERNQGLTCFTVSIDNLPDNVRAVVQAVPRLDNDTDGEQLDQPSCRHVPGPL